MTYAEVSAILEKIEGRLNTYGADVTAWVLIFRAVNALKQKVMWREPLSREEAEFLADLSAKL